MSRRKPNLLRFAASPRLTVVLLAMSLVLVFAATLAQRHGGIWHIVRDYFRSGVVMIELAIFTPGDWTVPGAFPWPGGYLLGSALLINLVAAHLVRFRATLKRIGIDLIHLALFLLLIGEGVTGSLAIETQMPIYENQTRHWSQDLRVVELAVIDHDTSPDHDQVIVFPGRLLQAAAAGGVSHPDLPFTIRVERFMVNADIERRVEEAGAGPHAFEGLGRHLRTIALDEVAGVEGQTIDYPAAVVSLSAEGRALGRYLLSPQMVPALMMGLFPADRATARALIGAHAPHDQVSVIGQSVSVGERRWWLSLRFRRHYKPDPARPYAIHLKDFTHDRYTGTNTPRNFASTITLTDPERGEVRDDVKIHMNHPLRYRGETFYQSGWLGDDRGTILQVVENPGWGIPYVACLLGGLGMLVHFGIHLVGFLRRTGR